MSLSENTDSAVGKIKEAISVPLTEEQTRQVTKAVEKALIDTVLETCQSSSQAIIRCCSADRDMAHKLNEEIERGKEALIANLSSLR